jgi:hypothetical protein
MAAKDPWVCRWSVYGVQTAGGQYLGPGSFKLEAVPDSLSGETAFYRVTEMSLDMPPCWKGLRLFPRGSEPSDQPPQILPKWTKDYDPLWEKAATSLRSKYTAPSGSIPGIDPALLRLEGDLHPRSEAEALTLVRVAGAVQDGTDLLVLMLKSKQQSRFEEDGTAHGGNPG